MLFGLLRAAGEEDDVVVRDAGELAERLRARVVAIGLSTVVLERAGDDDAIGRRAECAKAVGRFVVLSGDQVDLPQHGGNERTNAAIAGEAVIAQPAVDDRDSRAVILGRPDQVRPKLQFGEHQDRGPNAAHRVADGPTEIERAIEHAEVGVLLAGQFVTGAAGRRDDELPIGMGRSQFAQQDGDEIDFADADGVDPDARSIALAARHQAQQLLAKAFAILTGAQRLPRQSAASKPR